MRSPLSFCLEDLRTEERTMWKFWESACADQGLPRKSQFRDHDPDNPYFLQFKRKRDEVQHLKKVAGML